MLALATCCLMTLAMGTLHAWSVFSADLEQTLGISRAQSSLVYSLTLVTLTTTVLLAVPLFNRLKPWQIFAGASGLAGIGLYLSSGGSLPNLFVGYSLLFGIANGLGYGFALQLSAKVYSHRSGFAMGLTTAAYALGATVGAQLLGNLVDSVGAMTTIRLQGISFFILTPVLAILIYISSANYENDSTSTNRSKINRSRVNHYRLCYGLAVFAGLMAIAHATPFISSFIGKNNIGTTESANLALWGTILLGFGNTAGGVLAGVAADKYNPKTLLTLLPILAGAALGTAAYSPNAEFALAALVFIGFTYGALIAVYPVAIARDFDEPAAAYGLVFIAWGAAGLFAPVIAGAIYDVAQTYRYPMLLAMLLSLASAIAAYRLQPLAR